MTTDRDATLIVRSWLEEGVTVLPDRVLDAVLDQLPATRQRRARWPTRRFADMNNVNRIAIAAAAVLVVGVVGINVLPRSNQEAGPAVPTVGPDPQPGQLGGPVPIMGTTYDDPGTYRVGVWFPVQFDFTIKEKWETWAAGPDIVRIWKPAPPDTGEPGDTHSAILSFEIVRNTYADPCRAVLSPQIGDSVDDLVGALTDLPGYAAGPVTDISVDGHAGKSFELDKVSNPDGAACLDGGDWLWVSDGPVSFGTGAHMIVRIVDVDGTRLVMLTVLYGGDEQEVEKIIDSIDFK